MTDQVLGALATLAMFLPLLLTASVMVPGWRAARRAAQPGVARDDAEPTRRWWRRVQRRRLAHHARRTVTICLDALGLTLIIYSAWLVSTALGCLVAGVIALGVAVVLTPTEGDQEQDDESTERM